MYKFNFLKNRKEEIVILGEMHGVKENVVILKKIIEFYLKQKEPVILALEWPKKLTREINEHLYNKNKKINWRKWEFISYNDGRISYEHIKFLNWLKIKNKTLSKEFKVRVYCFDERNNAWNKRDKKMAKNLLSLRNNYQYRILMVVGSLHARKKKFFLGKQKYIPLASYLPKAHTLSFKLKYISGSFFNISLRNIKPETKEKLLRPVFIRRSKSPNFDYEIIIRKAHPITILN